MSIFKLLFLAHLAWSCLYVGRNGDLRDGLLLSVIFMQAMATYAIGSVMPLYALLFTTSGLVSVWFSVRPHGLATGALAFLMSILALAAWLGYLPSERGQGITYNYYNYMAICHHLQLLAITTGVWYGTADSLGDV